MSGRTLLVENDLRCSLEAASGEGIPRQVRSVSVIVRSNCGEASTYTFADLGEALEFMQTYNERRDIDTSNAPSLLGR